MPTASSNGGVLSIWGLAFTAASIALQMAALWRHMKRMAVLWRVLLRLAIFVRGVARLWSRKVLSRQMAPTPCVSACRILNLPSLRPGASFTPAISGLTDGVMMSIRAESPFRRVTTAGGHGRLFASFTHLFRRCPPMDIRMAAMNRLCSRSKAEGRRFILPTKRRMRMRSAHGRIFHSLRPWTADRHGGVRKSPPSRPNGVMGCRLCWRTVYGAIWRLRQIPDRQNYTLK